MAVPGISTLGIKLGWTTGSADTTPTTGLKLLTRINAIGGIALSTETIDASALEDYISQYVDGRADTGGTVPITVNTTDDTIKEWQAVFAESQSNNGVWFEVYHPSLTQAFYFFAKTPTEFPMPEAAQNSLETVEITLTIVKYAGLAAKSEPTADAGDGN